MTSEKPKKRKTWKQYSSLMRDPLLRALAGGTVLLAILYVGLYLVWGAGPVLTQVPWYNPMMYVVLAMAAVSVTFLAFGRYEVLKEPVSFWMGMAFLGFTVGITFYILAWPGMRPDGRSVIAQLSNTPTFMSVLAPGLLGVVLLAAVLTRWPGERTATARRWP